MIQKISETLKKLNKHYFFKKKLSVWYKHVCLPSPLLLPLYRLPTEQVINLDIVIGEFSLDWKGNIWLINALLQAGNRKEGDLYMDNLVLHTDSSTGFTFPYLLWSDITLVMTITCSFSATIMNYDLCRSLW